MKNTRILLVGCGVMGGTLKQGWERAKVPFETIVIDPSSPEFLPNLEALPRGFTPDVILFAVKPQTLPEILPLYKPFSGSGCLFVSIAAGIPLETFHKALGDNEHIIRAMPNLPATVGKGMAILVSKRSLSPSHRSLGQSIFEASGKALWVDNESYMDIVTALSGSGPAYFFRMVECLASAAAMCGLPPDIAMTLARQTAIGAGAMMEQTPDPVTELRIRVTSPGGTTAAALSSLDYEDAFGKLIRTALKAAIHRGQELAL